MNIIDWINFDLIMNFIYIFSAILFGWLIKNISTPKNLYGVIAGYILYLVLLTMLWIGWIPSVSKKLVYASFLGLAIWVGVGIYKLMPNVIT